MKKNGNGVLGNTTLLLFYENIFTLQLSIILRMMKLNLIKR